MNSSLSNICCTLWEYLYTHEPLVICCILWAYGNICGTLWTHGNIARLSVSPIKSSLHICNPFQYTYFKYTYTIEIYTQIFRSAAVYLYICLRVYIWRSSLCISVNIHISNISIHLKYTHKSKYIDQRQYIFIFVRDYIFDGPPSAYP